MLVVGGCGGGGGCGWWWWLMVALGDGGWLVELGVHGGSLVELASRVVPHLRGERG